MAIKNLATVYAAYDDDDKTLIVCWPADPKPLTEDIIEQYIESNESKKIRLILVDSYEGEMYNQIKWERKSSTLIIRYLEMFKEVYLIKSSFFVENTIDYVKKMFSEYDKLKCGGNLKYEWLAFEKCHLLEHPDQYVDEFSRADRHFISLNGSPRYYRGLLIDTMMNQKLIDTMYYSWLCPTTEHSYKIFDCNKEVLLDVNRTDLFKDFALVPEEYHHGLIDLFIESESDGFDYKDVFITEKTWKPIIRRKPFFGFNSAGYYEALQNAGFKLYDKLFDYSFDSIVDHNERFDKFMENVFRIAWMPLDDVKALAYQHSDDIEFNFTHAWNIKPEVPEVLKPYYQKLEFLFINSFEIMESRWHQVDVLTKKRSALR